MKLVDYSPAYFDAVKALFRSRGLPFEQADVLESGKLYVRDNGTVIASGFLFTGKKLSWLAFLATHPAASQTERHVGLDQVIHALCREAKAAGCVGVVATLGHEDLIARHQAHGFQVMDQGVTSLIKKL